MTFLALRNFAFSVHSLEKDIIVEKGVNAHTTNTTKLYQISTLKAAIRTTSLTKGSKSDQEPGVEEKLVVAALQLLLRNMKKLIVSSISQ